MAAVCSSSVMRRPASTTEYPADCMVSATARPIPLPAPVTIATLPCPLPLPALSVFTSSFSSLFGIEAIVNVPMCCLSWGDDQVMVGLRANRSARRPEVEKGNGVVPGLLAAHPRLCIFDHHFVASAIPG